MGILLETPYPPLETSRTFFDSAEGPEALFLVQAMRLNVVCESTKVHLPVRQETFSS